MIVSGYFWISGVLLNGFKWIEIEYGMWITWKFIRLFLLECHFNSSLWLVTISFICCGLMFTAKWLEPLNMHTALFNMKLKSVWIANYSKLLNDFFWMKWTFFKRQMAIFTRWSILKFWHIILGNSWIDFMQILYWREAGERQRKSIKLNFLFLFWHTRNLILAYLKRRSEKNMKIFNRTDLSLEWCFAIAVAYYNGICQSRPTVCLAKAAGSDIAASRAWRCYCFGRGFSNPGAIGVIQTWGVIATFQPGWCK